MGNGYRIGLARKLSPIAFESSRKNRGSSWTSDEILARGLSTWLRQRIGYYFPSEELYKITTQNQDSRQARAEAMSIMSEPQDPPRTRESYRRLGLSVPSAFGLIAGAMRLVRTRRIPYFLFINSPDIDTVSKKSPQVLVLQRTILVRESTGHIFGIKSMVRASADSMNE